MSEKFFRPKITQRGEKVVLKQRGARTITEERNSRGERHGVYLDVSNAKSAYFKTKAYFVDGVPIFSTVKIRTPHSLEIFRTRFNDGLPMFSSMIYFSEDEEVRSMIRYRNGKPFEVREREGRYKIIWDDENHKLEYIDAGNGRIVESYSGVEVAKERQEFDDREGLITPSRISCITFSPRIWSRVYATNAKGDRVCLDLPVFSQ
ncbi:hypothetical protein GMAR_ORF110 [Golden Marseillevirus]|uniref:hypothetical protein n=1 Tax=Golden Marseillevirus TaxID=1720526 RepID=UPI000877AF3C|nr:hypothetical protein GMAR_ORF110 [Golden Marseillevirus]ALX27484.1 hypothetical protein GMAR_ORF110 [Golden Marseillevirus]